MRTIATTVDMAAPPMDVWTVLADLNRYPEWNPHLREGAGEVTVGSRITLRMFPATGRTLAGARASFREQNEALKKRAENRHRPESSAAAPKQATSARFIRSRSATPLPSVTTIGREIVAGHDTRTRLRFRGSRLRGARANPLLRVCPGPLSSISPSHRGTMHHGPTSPWRRTFG